MHLLKKLHNILGLLAYRPTNITSNKLYFEISIHPIILENIIINNIVMETLVYSFHENMKLLNCFPHW